MKLPFAVYTAREGYGWASGLTHGRGLLERLRRAVGKTPDFDYGAAPCCGAVNDGDTVVVYRFMRAEKWDSKGRNAAYLTLSFYPRSQAGEVDAESLLAAEPFRMPMREPPEWLEYAGGGAGASSFDPDAESGGVTGVDLRNAGCVFAKAFAGTLRVSREEGTGADSCRVNYRRAQPVLPEPATLPVESDRPFAREADATRSPTGVSIGWLGVFARAALVVAASAMFAGVIYWCFAINGKRSGIVGPACGKANGVERCGDRFNGLFDADGHWQGVAGCLIRSEGKDGLDE